MEFKDIAKNYFDRSITDRERAIFEGAITLGAIYHQFVGTPICRNEEVVRALEKAISKTMRLQPYKEEVEVKIDIEALKAGKDHAYDYEILGNKHMDVRVISKYGDARVTVRMRYVPEIKYNLMYVEKIEENMKEQ